MSGTQLQEFNSIQSRIHLPGKYHRQPVISRLISRYGLTINIVAGDLKFGERNQGYFDIEVSGKSENLISSLSYLQGLGIDLIEVGIANNLKPSILFAENSSNLSKGNSVNDSANPWIITSTNLQNQSNTKIKENFIGISLTRVRSQLCIYRKYHNKPIISTLVSKYGVTVNIISAFLKPDTKDHGWFSLELWGKPQQIYSSLAYLEKLEIQVLIGLSYYQHRKDLS